MHGLLFTSSMSSLYYLLKSMFICIHSAYVWALGKYIYLYASLSPSLSVVLSQRRCPINCELRTSCWGMKWISSSPPFSSSCCLNIGFTSHPVSFASPPFSSILPPQQQFHQPPPSCLSLLSLSLSSALTALIFEITRLFLCVPVCVAVNPCVAPSQSGMFSLIVFWLACIPGLQSHGWTHRH